MELVKKVGGFAKKEAVLCISACFAALSMLAVPPSEAYFEYIDVRVLCLLFCLMAVVVGLQDCGLFEALAKKLLTGKKQIRILMLTLVLLPFFCSMIVTNDVALITFVPFTILVLNMIDKRESMIWIVALQTVAANLGSMATPVGNPQNLFLYSNYDLMAGEFFREMLPLTLISLICLCVAALWTKKETIEVEFQQEEGEKQVSGPLGMYLILFALCLLSVFRVLSYGALTVIVFFCMFLFARPLLKKIDYSLLLTFVCFFIFAGNIGAIPEIRSLLGSLLAQNTLISSVVASQFISNVPAAVLLSGFTADWSGLLMGVNIGGLGIPIASLASLISLKFYLQEKDAKPMKYLAVFLLANLAGLLILIPAAELLM